MQIVVDQRRVTGNSGAALRARSHRDPQTGHECRAGLRASLALLLPWWDQGLVQLTLLGAGELLPSAVNPNEVEAPPPRPPL